MIEEFDTTLSLHDTYSSLALSACDVAVVEEVPNVLKGEAPIPNSCTRNHHLILKLARRHDLDYSVMLKIQESSF